MMDLEQIFREPLTFLEEKRTFIKRITNNKGEKGERFQMKMFRQRLLIRLDLPLAHEEVLGPDGTCPCPSWSCC